MVSLLSKGSGAGGGSGAPTGTLEIEQLRADCRNDSSGETVAIDFRITSVPAGAGQLQAIYRFTSAGEERRGVITTVQPRARDYTLEWRWRDDLDPRGDAGGSLPETVFLELRVPRTGHGSEKVAQTAIKLVNRAPRISVEVDEKESVPGLTKLRLVVKDTTSDPVRMRASFRKEEESEAHDTEFDRSLGVLESLPQGKEYTFFWSPNWFPQQERLVGYEGRVELQFEAEDLAGEEDCWSPAAAEPVSLFIDIDNNNAPVVSLAEVGGVGAGELGGDVVLHCVLTDDVSDLSSVAVQWTEVGAEFPSLAEYAPDELRKLLLDDSPASGRERRKLHLITPADVHRTGRSDAFIVAPSSSTAWRDSIRFRETALVRDGLVYPAVTAERTTGIAMGQDNLGFVVGRTIELMPVAERLSGYPAAARLVSLNPASSMLTLEWREDDPGRWPPPEAGLWNWSMDANAGLVDLLTDERSERRNAYHFVWRSNTDIGARQADVRIRITPFDTGFGPSFTLEVPGVDSRVPLVPADLEPPECGLFPVAMARGDLDGDGWEDITVLDRDPPSLRFYFQVLPEPQLSTSQAKNSVVRRGRARFLERLPAIGLRASPVDLLLSDFDADGKLDVVVVNQDASFTVLGGLGQGLFTRSRTVRLAESGNLVLVAGAVTDVEGDGDGDVLLAGNPRGPREMSHRGLLLAVRDVLDHSVARIEPILTPPDRIDGTGLEPQTVASVELDAAHRQFAVLVPNRRDDTLSVLVYERLGPRVALVDSELLPTDPGPVDVTCLPLGGTPPGQMAVVANQEGKTLTLYVQEGSRFVFSERLSLRGKPVRVISGDFDGDGLEDIAVSFTSAEITILQQRVDPASGRSEFVGNTRLELTSPAVAMAAIPVARDSGIDLAVLESPVSGGKGTIEVFRQKRSYFRQDVDPLEFVGQRRLWAVAAGDVTNNGLTDLVATGSGLFVLEQLLSGAFHKPEQPYFEGVSLSLVSIGDLDGDARLDIIAVEGVPSFPTGDDVGIRILFNSFDDDTSAAPFTDRRFEVPDSDGDESRGLAVGDIGGANSSGAALLVRSTETADDGGVTHNAKVFRLRLVGAEQKFATDVIAEWPEIDEASHLEVADIDGDGREDVVVVLESGEEKEFGLAYQSSEGGFMRGESIGVLGGTLTGAAVGDFDGNGLVDLAVADSGGSAGEAEGVIHIFWQRTPRRFDRRHPSHIEVPPSPFALAVADVDGDDVSDLIAVCNPTAGRPTVVVLRQRPALRRPGADPAAAFVREDLPLGLGVRSFGLTVGDLDADGDQDLALPLDDGRLVVVTQHEVR